MCELRDVCYVNVNSPHCIYSIAANFRGFNIFINFLDTIIFTDAVNVTPNVYNYVKIT